VTKRFDEILEDLGGDAPPEGERLQKFLAAAGVASRRHAEVLIRQGRVTVNGDVAQLGMRVEPSDVVRVNGIEVGPQAPRYVMLNKPPKTVTTSDDPQGRPTVVDLVPSDVRLYAVGRLDADTTGLLLLTNDGELAHRLMHPSFGVDKTYRCLCEGSVSDATARKLSAGVELEDGPTAPAKCRVIQRDGEQSIVDLTIHEGRNRQVRRMLAHVGHPVVALGRTHYGPLSLGDLSMGAHRDLSQQEIRRLLKVAGMSRPRARDSERAGEADADVEAEAPDA
jgi:pseudouridine synthase